MRTEIVPATKEMIENFMGRKLVKTVRAVAAVRTDKVVGFAGLYSDYTRTIMFSKLSDELREDKRGLVRLIKTMHELSKPRAPIYAEADMEIEGSAKLLEHMGFRPVRDNLYVWEA